MKRLFLLTLLIQFLCAVTVIGVRSLFAAAGSPFAVRVRADTQMTAQVWCWRGVCAGKTPITSAKTQLTSVADDSVRQTDIGTATELHWESRANPSWTSTINAAGAMVNAIHVAVPDEQLLLGDVVAQLGRPSFTYSQLTVYQKNSVLVLKLATFICFDGGLCAEVSPDGCNSWTRYDAYMPIRELFFYPSTWAREQLGSVSAWESFGRAYVRCPVVLN